MVGILKAIEAIVAAVAQGELTPSEAAELSKVVDGFTRAVDTVELAVRVAQLEQRLSIKSTRRGR